MYQFRPISPRIQEMRSRIRNRRVQLDSERARIITEEFKKHVTLVPTIRRPTITKAVAEQTFDYYYWTDGIVVASKIVCPCCLQ